MVPEESWALGSAVGREWTHLGFPSSSVASSMLLWMLEAWGWQEGSLSLLQDRVSGPVSS